LFEATRSLLFQSSETSRERIIENKEDLKEVYLKKIKIKKITEMIDKEYI